MKQGGVRGGKKVCKYVQLRKYVHTASDESGRRVMNRFRALSRHSCDRCVSRYKCGSTHTISCTATGFNRPVIKCSSQSSLPPWWPFCVPSPEQTTIMTFISKSTLELGSVSREEAISHTYTYPGSENHLQSFVHVPIPSINVADLMSTCAHSRHS